MTVRMQRFGLVCVALFVLLAAVGLVRTRPAALAQDGDSAIQTAVADLQTRVAALETRAATPAGTPFSPPVAALATPVSLAAATPTLASSPVYGNAWEFLTTGMPGEVSVVASGAVAGYAIPVIIRNNTDRPKAYVQVGAEVRDGAGTLVAVGGSYQFLPTIVQPGEYAIGGVGFGGVELPQGASATFDVSASDDVDLYSLNEPINVELVEFNAQPETIVGSFRNRTGTAIMGGIYFTLACFDDDGTLLASEPGTATRTDLAPGETTAFRAFQLGLVPQCNHYLVTGYGNSK